MLSKTKAKGKQHTEAWCFSAAGDVDAAASSGKKRKFPPESTERIFFSCSRGCIPDTNLNLQIQTSLSANFSGGKKMAERFLRRRNTPPDADDGELVDGDVSSLTHKFNGWQESADVTFGAISRQISPLSRFRLRTREMLAIGFHSLEEAQQQRPSSPLTAAAMPQMALRSFAIQRSITPVVYN